MINLDDALFVGKGKHRVCYQHPEDENLCVKVVISGYLKESLRERQYYHSLLRRNISWQLLPRYHGEIETNLGVGFVFDLVRNNDGSPAKSLDHYLASKTLVSEYRANIAEALANLKRYLLDQAIITANIKPRNIVCQQDKTGSLRAFVVDDIGNTEFFPISSFSKTVARMKLERKWKRFEETFFDSQLIKTVHQYC